MGCSFCEPCTPPSTTSNHSPARARKTVRPRLPSRALAECGASPGNEGKEFGGPWLPFCSVRQNSSAGSRVAWSIPLANPSTKISMQFASSELEVDLQSSLKCCVYPFRTVTKVARGRAFSDCVTPRKAFPADNTSRRGTAREIRTGCTAPLSSLPMGLGSSAGLYNSERCRSKGAWRGIEGSMCGGTGRGFPLLSRLDFLPSIGGRRWPTSEGVVGVL